MRDDTCVYFSNIMIQNLRKDWRGDLETLGCPALMGRLGFQGGSLALYSNPARAVLVFTNYSMSRQYLEQLDSKGELADAAGGGAA